MDLYKELAAYDEVKRVLTDLKKKNIVCAILSIGSLSMLNSAVKSAEIPFDFELGEKSAISAKVKKVLQKINF